MKLHLVIAVVICMKVAAANLTSDVGNHVQLVADAAQRGTRISRHLRSDVATEFAEELNKAFVNIARRDFAYDGEAEMSEAEADKIARTEKKSIAANALDTLNLDAQDVNLLRNPVFLRWLHHHTRENAKLKFGLVYTILKEAHKDDIVAMVKTVNAGLMDKKPESRDLALQVESLVRKPWNMTPDEAFEALKLNDIKNEYELYANPVFGTWLRYVNRNNPDDWVVKVYDVFSKYEHLKNFKGVAAFGKLTLEGELLPEAVEWDEKIKYLERYRGYWDKLLNSKQQ